MAKYECRIKEYRLLRGLTQRQLAQQVGTRQDVIGILERGKHEPLLSTALAVSRALDMPVEEMFIFHDKTDPPRR